MPVSPPPMRSSSSTSDANWKNSRERCSTNLRSMRSLNWRVRPLMLPSSARSFCSRDVSISSSSSSTVDAGLSSVSASKDSRKPSRSPITCAPGPAGQPRPKHGDAAPPHAPKGRAACAAHRIVRGDAKLVQLRPEQAQLAVQLVAPLDKRREAALEGRLLLVQLRSGSRAGA